MKIVDKRNHGHVVLSGIKPGDAFGYGGQTYVLSTETAGDVYIALRICDGKTYKFRKDVEVYKLRAKLVLY